MKTCSGCGATKEESEFRVRRASRDGLSAKCSVCARAANQQHYEENKTQYIVRSAKNQSIREKDPAYKRAWNAWKHAKEISRVPAWVTFTTDMLDVYVRCIAAGEGHEVDHIIPLQGKTVSGLHVPSNVRVTTRTNNGIKHDHFDEAWLPMYDAIRDLQK